MKQFDSEDFRYFAVLARTLHLGQAARLLSTSPATVLRRVRALELALNSKLFVRRRDGHRLTKAGLALVPKARELETLLDDIGAAIGHDDRRTHGRVRIATTEVGANWILLPALIAFQKKWPDIALEIDANSNTADLLDDGDSVALRFHRPTTESVVIKKLGAVAFNLYATQEVWALDAVDGTAQKHRAPYIGWAGALAQTSMARWISSEFLPVKPALSFTTLQAQIDAARVGLGVIVLPEFIGEQISGLIKAKSTRSTLSLDAWLVIPSQTRHVARIRNVSRFIVDAFKHAIS